MLDVEFIRQHPDAVREAVRNKGETGDVDGFLALDERRRRLLAEVEALRSRRNANSKKVGAIRKSGGDAQAIMDETRGIAEEIRRVEGDLAELDTEFNAAVLTFPNVPAPDVQVGRDANDNVEVRRWGEPRTYAFEPKDHVDLGAPNGWIDFEAAGAVYYADLRDKVTDPKEKAFFNLLADMEHEHYVSLKDTEELMTNPAGWFRDKERTGLDGG